MSISDSIETNSPIASTSNLLSLPNSNSKSYQFITSSNRNSPNSSYGSFPPSVRTIIKSKVPSEVSYESNYIKNEFKSKGKLKVNELDNNESSSYSTTPMIISPKEEDSSDLEIETNVDSINKSRSISISREGAGLSRKSSRMEVIDNDFIESRDEEKQWGVVKMELMGRFWGRKGLITVFVGVYLISAFTSLESNTTPTIEPYFLSLLNSHSLLGVVYIVQNIAFAVGKPFLTKVLDVFGRAEGVILSVILYSLGYLLTASSTSASSFMVARAISALGGQGLQLASQVLIADTTTLTNRGLLTSTISLPWLVTTWIGPLLGQFFQSRGEIGYRIGYALFGLLLPIAASVLISTLLLEWRKVKQLASLPASSTVRSRRRASNSSTYSEIWSNKFPVLKEEMEARNEGSLFRKMGQLWKELDIIGLIALTLSCGFILLPLSLAARRPNSWADPSIWGLILLGVAIFIFFIYYESNVSAIPLLPSRLLKNRTIICGSILGFFHFCSQFCYESFFTSFLQVARDQSPSSAAYIAQSYIFSASVFAIVAGLGSKFTKRYKWIGIVGVIVHMIGTLLMSRARRLDSSTFELVISQVVGGIGGGLTTIAAQIGCQSVVGHQHVAVATAIFLTITQIGGAVGAAIAGAVWSTLLPIRLRIHLPIESHYLIEEIISSLTNALSYPMESPIRQAIIKSYTDVQIRLNILAVILLFPALIAVCLMRNVHLENDDQGQGEGVVVLGKAEFLSLDEDTDSSETSSLLSRH